MAKVAFSKLGVKTNQEVKTITWNDQTIEVKQYLPVNNKLELASRVINFYWISKIILIRRKIDNSTNQF